MKQMQETWVPSLGREDALEEEMATHSSILTWRILWTEEPGGLQSMGSQSWTRLSTAWQGPASDQGEAVSETGREEGADGGLCHLLQSLHVVGLGVHLLFQLLLKPKGL